MLNKKKIIGTLLTIAILIVMNDSVAVAVQDRYDIGTPTKHIEYEYINGEKIASQILSTSTNASSESGAFVEFDREKTISKLVKHLLENNPTMSENEALSNANQLADNIQDIEKESQVAYERSINSECENTVIVPIGKITDNSFSPVDLGANPNIFSEDMVSINYIPDSRTSIISEGWSVNPYKSKSTLWVHYTISWYGLDNYKTPLSGEYYHSQTTTISKSLGFNGSGDLKASDALKFNLKVTGNYTKSQSIQRGYKLNVMGWTKALVRPYIYYYIDDYIGKYRYYCYNNFDKTYFYVNETRTATNSYDLESSNRSWSRTNSAENPDATSPIPPTEWEW